MKTIHVHVKRVIVLGILGTVIGCTANSSVTSAKGASLSHTGKAAALAQVPSKRVSNRPANVNGSVFVTEYHHIRKGKGDMFRPVDSFRNDLEQLYSLGFRPVLASEYLANTMRLPPGASPVVMTFDDATPSQVQLLKDGTVDPDCAIGIWQDFAKTHPDFPVHATFFVLPDVMWGPRKFDARKVKLIHELGSELANHTVTHPKLSHLSDSKVKWELGTATERLEGFGQRAPHSMALPYGISPKNKSLLKGFDWNGKHIVFTGVFLVGANPAPAPTDRKFNRYRIPRIMAISGPYGIDYWLGQLKRGRVKPYVQP